MIRRWSETCDTSKLSSKERKVANLAQAGLRNGEIAKRLRLTTSTVDFIFPTSTTNSRSPDEVNCVLFEFLSCRPASLYTIASRPDTSCL
ncbi:LuxR C-terminal-related transcriptional regulator [Amycolatopsis speibonae]|uniref:LuxR C-terminal-related transcriptional regulator n=1 Tax=Amycolatopsis speibonae TaxID=1450224 RepID=A0ABV7PAG8_9PSEU